MSSKSPLTTEHRCSPEIFFLLTLLCMLGKYCNTYLQPQLKMKLLGRGGTLFLLTGPLTFFLDPFCWYPVAPVGTVTQQLWSGLIHCGDRPLNDLTSCHPHCLVIPTLGIPTLVTDYIFPAFLNLWTFGSLRAQDIPVFRHNF